MTKKSIYILVLLVLLVVSIMLAASLFRSSISKFTGNYFGASVGYAGAVSCRGCHEQFYELWATSHHGLAMQPYTNEFAEKELRPQAEAIKINKYDYIVEIEQNGGFCVESSTKGQKKYPIVHVMGGKNVYYFLTPMDQGRLQVLPIAYDVRRQEWFDTAASSVRHFPDAPPDTALHWTDPFYTFNTSCYGCHVSQLSTNYDLKTDTYHTTWAEPGINCETCHGPSAEHIKVCEAARAEEEPNDLNIIITRNFDTEQSNSLCASCHAKLTPITTSFKPGDRYFDHFDLTTLENPDFYPDGRDLGENYTYTTWRMSACAKSGKLDCSYCHTSSGRYRFKAADKANNACLPCHKERVENATAHTHHLADSDGNKCVMCHMPMTEFARMTRSDHSMRPPAPAATITFKSPNACNICHTDKDAAWSDKYVRQWHKHDYQKSILEAAHLVAAAREQDWTHLDDILTYLGYEDRDEVTATSLIRLLHASNSEKKWAVIIRALKDDPSPMVRAAAAEALNNYFTSESIHALLVATRDEYRVVRVHAASSLTAVAADMIAAENKEDLIQATEEYISALSARPDGYTSHYNLGNFYMTRREYPRALSSYQTAIKLRPDFLPPYVNAAFAYNATGQNDKAEKSFRKALNIEPNNAPIHLNLGMLLAERRQIRKAETEFRMALRLDPNSAVAAYNLGIILANDRIDEALKWCRKAHTIQPDQTKYAYTYAFYLRQNGAIDKAIEILTNMIDRQVPDPDVYILLGDIYEKQGQFLKAKEVYSAALRNSKLSDSQRYQLSLMILRKESPEQRIHPK